MSTRLPLSFNLIAKTEKVEPPHFDVLVSLVMRAGAETVTIWKEEVLIFDDGLDSDHEGRAIERAIGTLRELLFDVLDPD